MTMPVLSLLRILAVASVLFAAHGAGAAFAQATPAGENATSVGATAQAAPGGSELLAGQQAVIRGIATEAGQLELRMRDNAEDDSVLVDVRNRLDELARRLISSGVTFRPRLSAINDRLDQIGPAPASDQPPEPPALRDERQELISEKAEINTLLGEAETLSLRVNRMIDTVAQMRRDLFTNTLSRRYDISTALSPAVLEDLGVELQRLTQSVSSWLRFIVNFRLQPVLMATFFALLAAVVLFFGGRRLFGGLVVPDPGVETPSYLSRLSVAFWSTLLSSATVAMFLFATYFFYNYYAVLRSDIAQMMVTLFNVIAIVYFVYRLTAVIFAPRNPTWRLVPIETPAARTLFWLAWLTALVTGADFFMSKVNDVMSSPLSLTVAKSLFATVIVGLLVMAIGLVKPYRGYDGRPRGWHPLFRGLLFVLGGGTILAAMLGYIGLARFISQQIVVTGAILATMYIGYLSAAALSDLGAFTKTALGKRLDAYFNLDESTEDQFGLVASITINLLVLALGIPLILLQWGFQWGDIQSWAYNIVTEVRVGSITISIIGILTGIAVFILGYFATRGFQRWLDGKVMSRGKVDAGVRNSIGTAVGYAGVALAGLIGISAAGIDLSNIALVAGALSLGIGFGLQNIVNNFVSGLILLAERPFKAGDWIVAGAVEGTVKKISVRATEIETFRRQTVILPNSELINAAVGNWTHRNRLGRIEVLVRVAYGADVRRVHELLMEIARGHPQVLRNPEPMVVLLNLGEGALEFEMRVFLADITSQGGIANELRFQILEVFLREDIGIALVARDVYPKPPEEPDAEPPVLAVPEEPPAAPRKRRKPV
ncbi:mechanosensitive ion channel domain-containing protein [Mesorhizobium sp. CAU 1732]|uniref:mechanosensitive ion channel family protein n=1 Tax=Mesorhizobium sp. CAU 1732 TaxID=3140358 RepID=UPI0032615C5B